MLHTLRLVKLTNNEKVLLQNIIKTRPRNSTSHIFPQLLALACCWGQLTVYMYISSIDSVRLNCVFLRFASAKTFIPFCRQGKREVCDRWRVVANKWRPLFSFFLFIHLNEPTAFFFFTRVFVLLAFCRAHCYLRGVCEQSKLRMVCGEKGGKRSQMESDIYPETAVDPVIYISAYTAITMCLSFCSGGSQ